MDQAQEIVDCFWLKVGALYGARVVLVARVTGAYATFQHLTLGGVDRDGNDATNPVTFMALEAPARLQLHEPPVSLRVSKTTPDALFECAFESSKRAGGIPCFQNESLIIDALVGGGHYSLEDARDFCIIGCQEIGGSGNDYPATGGIHSLADVNLANVLLLALNNGVSPLSQAKCAPETGYLYEMETFDDVLAAVKTQIEYFVEWLLTLNNCAEWVSMKDRLVPALSAMLDGCMESGKDCVCGGAKYNSFGVPATGVATLSESLIAIKYMCYDAKLCTPRELYDAVMANWAGHEPLRQQILNMPHHYGNNDPYADALVKWSMDTFSSAVCRGYSTRGRFRPGLFTASSHVFAGRARLGDSRWALHRGVSVRLHLAQTGRRRERPDGRADLRHLLRSQALHQRAGSQHEIRPGDPCERRQPGEGAEPHGHLLRHGRHGSAVQHRLLGDPAGGPGRSRDLQEPRGAGCRLLGLFRRIAPESAERHHREDGEPGSDAGSGRAGPRERLENGHRDRRHAR